MKSRFDVGTVAKCAAVAAAVVLATVFAVPFAGAADEVAGRNIGHTQKSEVIEVGDVQGHFMGVTQFQGMSFYTKGPDAGEIVPRTGVGTFDVVKGKGTMTGHEIKTFKDGSTIVIKYSGTQAPLDGGKKTAYDVAWEVAGGTGRYAGATGSGTARGERIGDLKTGGDNYVDFAGTITMK